MNFTISRINGKKVLAWAIISIVGIVSISVSIYYLNKHFLKDNNKKSVGNKNNDKSEDKTSKILSNLKNPKNFCYFISAIHFIKHFITFDSLNQECEKILKSTVANSNASDGSEDVNCPNHVSCFLIKLIYKLKNNIQQNKNGNKDRRVKWDSVKLINIFRKYILKNDKFYNDNKNFIKDFEEGIQQDSKETILKLFGFFQKEVNSIAESTILDKNCLLKREFKFWKTLRKLTANDNVFCINLLFTSENKKNLQTRLEEIFNPAKDDDDDKKSTSEQNKVTQDLQTEEYIPVILERCLIRNEPKNPFSLTYFKAYDIPNVILIFKLQYELVFFIAYSSNGISKETGQTLGHYFAYQKFCNKWYELDDAKEIPTIIKEKLTDKEEKDFINEKNNLIAAVIYKKKQNI